MIDLAQIVGHLLLSQAEVANTILSLSIIWCQAKIDRLTPPAESAHIQPPHLKVPLHHTSAEALAEALRPWLQRLQEPPGGRHLGGSWMCVQFVTRFYI